MLYRFPRPPFVGQQFLLPYGPFFRIGPGVPPLGPSGPPIGPGVPPPVGPGGRPPIGPGEPGRPSGSPPPVGRPPRPPAGPGQQPGDQSMPPGRPPAGTPERPASLFAVDPGAIRRCRYRFVYLWLENGQEFWAYLVFVGRRSVAGYRWIGFRWVYFGTDIRNIESFICS